MSMEEEVKKLSRTPENKRCACCNAEATFGHGNVCMPFRCFVCGNCKTALQEFSFRVKSVTMSNFTAEEVDSLRARNGGGNEWCRRTFMGRLPPTDPLRLKEGDGREKARAFVQRVFEDRAYFVDARTASSGGAAGGSATPDASPVAGIASPPMSPVRATSTGSASGSGSTPFSVAGTKGRWGPSGAAAIAASPAKPVVASGWDNSHQEVGDGSDGIKIRTAPPSGFDATPAASGGTDDFDLLGVGAVTTPSAFAFVSSPPAPAPAPAPGGGFSATDDLFSAMTSPSMPAPVPANPVAAVLAAYGSPNSVGSGSGGAISAAFAMGPASAPGYPAGVMRAPPQHPGMGGMGGASGGFMPPPSLGYTPSPTVGMPAPGGASPALFTSSSSSSMPRQVSAQSTSSAGAGLASPLDDLLSGLGMGGSGSGASPSVTATMGSPAAAAPLARTTSASSTTSSMGSMPVMGGTPIASPPMAMNMSRVDAAFGQFAPHMPPPMPPAGMQGMHNVAGGHTPIPGLPYGAPIAGGMGGIPGLPPRPGMMMMPGVPGSSPVVPVSGPSFMGTVASSSPAQFGPAAGTAAMRAAPAATFDPFFGM